MAHEDLQRFHRAQQKHKLHTSLAKKWNERLSNKLFDIAPPEDFLNVTTYKDGTKKFFLCNGRKEDVRKIDRGKVTLRSLTSNSSVVNDTNSITTTTTAASMSTAATPSESRDLYKNLLHPPSTSSLLSASFIQPTLRGSSFGPGDAHKRARANYYHVLDTLPPPELKVGECPNPLIYYKDSAPPPLKGKGSLLCGVSGKEIKGNHVLNYRSAEERVNFVTKPLASLQKGSGCGFKRRELHTENSLRERYRRIFESVNGEDGVGSESSYESTAKGSLASRSVRNSIDTKSLTESIEEMSQMLEELSAAGGSKDGNGGGAWDAAGLAIKKHFTLLKNNSNNSVHSGKSGLYKDVPVNRFYSRFLNEGPRRGDGCFESDPKEMGVRKMEVKLHQSNQARIHENMSLRGVPISSIPSTLKQEGVMRDLVARCRVARRKLMNSKIWQENNQRKMDRIRDRKNATKRSFRDIFGSDDEESEEEKEEVVVVKPPTREDLWMVEAPKEEEKPKAKKQGYSEREINFESLNILEEIVQEFVMEDIGEELAYIEEKCILACVLAIQGCWRASRWRKANPKHIRRLESRAKSRARKRAKEGFGEGAVAAAAEEGDGAPGNVWVQKFDEPSGHYYYENEITGESRWEQPEGYVQ